jgi:transcriptional regulator with XRE-family HTH domain
LRTVLEALAVKIKALRDQRGWTQTDLAKRARVSPGYIARLETNRHDPKLSTLVKIAAAFKVKVGRLLE